MMVLMYFYKLWIKVICATSQVIVNEVLNVKITINSIYWCIFYP